MFVLDILNLLNQVSCITMQKPLKDLGLVMVK